MKLLLSLVVLMTATVCLAQEGMMDMRPPAELKNLEFMLGEWTCELKTYGMGGGGDSTAKATIKTTKTLGDRFYKTEFVTDFEGMGRFEGLQLLSFDPEKKQYRCYWFDGMSSDVLDMSGTMTGGKLVLTSKPTPMPGMGEITFRATYERKPNSEIYFLLEMKQGNEWSKALEGTYKKK